jgi:hypothetical protein
MKVGQGAIYRDEAGRIRGGMIAGIGLTEVLIRRLDGELVMVDTGRVTVGNA